MRITSVFIRLFSGINAEKPVLSPLFRQFYTVIAGRQTNFIRNQTGTIMNEVQNMVQLSGNLGRDPEIRVFDGNKKMARFSIATPETITNALGEKIQQTQWHNAVAWGKTAELVEKSVSKGQHISVEGRLSSRSYLAKDGTRKYTTDIVVQRFEVHET